MQNKINPYNGASLEVTKQLVRNIISLGKFEAKLLSDDESLIETIFVELDLVKALYDVTGVEYPQEVVTGDKELDDEIYSESIKTSIKKVAEFYDDGIFMGFVKKDNKLYMVLDITTELVRTALRDGTLYVPVGSHQVDGAAVLADTDIQEETMNEISPKLSDVLACFGVSLDEVIDETIATIKRDDLEKTREQFEQLVTNYNEKVEALFISNPKWIHIMGAAKQLDPNITPAYLNEYSVLSILNKQYVDNNFVLISIFKSYLPTIENINPRDNRDLKLPVICVDGSGLFVEISGDVEVKFNHKLYSMDTIIEELGDLVYRTNVIPGCWFYTPSNLADEYGDINEYLKSDYTQIDSVETLGTILDYQYIKLKDNIDKILELYVKIFQYMLVAANMQKLDSYGQSS